MNDVGKFASGGAVGFKDGGFISFGEREEALWAGGQPGDIPLREQFMPGPASGGAGKVAIATNVAGALAQVTAELGNWSDSLQESISEVSAFAGQFTTTTALFNDFGNTANTVGVNLRRSLVHSANTAGLSIVESFKKVKDHSDGLSGVWKDWRAKQSELNAELDETTKALARLSESDIESMELDKDQEKTLRESSIEARDKVDKKERRKQKKKQRMQAMGELAQLGVSAAIAAYVTSLKTSAAELDKQTEASIKAGDSISAMDTAVKSSNKKFEANLVQGAAAAGAAVGSIFGPLGTAVGGAVGALAAFSGQLENLPFIGGAIAEAREAAAGEARTQAREQASGQALQTNLRGIETGLRLETNPERRAALEQRRAELVERGVNRQGTREIALGQTETVVQDLTRQFDEEVARLRATGMSFEDIKTQASTAGTGLFKLNEQIGNMTQTSVAGAGGLTEDTQQFSAEAVEARNIQKIEDLQRAEALAAREAEAFANRLATTRRELALMEGVAKNFSALETSTNQLTTTMRDSFNLLSGSTKLSPTVAAVGSFQGGGIVNQGEFESEVRGIGATMGVAGEEMAESFIQNASVFENLGPRLQDVLAGASQAAKDEEQRRTERKAAISAEIDAARAAGDKQKEKEKRGELTKLQEQQGAKLPEEFIGELLDNTFAGADEDTRKLLIAQATKFMKEYLKEGRLTKGAEEEIIAKLKKAVGIDKQEKFWQDAQQRQFKAIDSFINSYQDLLSKQLDLAQGINDVTAMEFRTRRMIAQATGKEIPLPDVRLQKEAERNRLLAGTGAAGQGADVGATSRRAIALQAKIERERQALNEAGVQGDKGAFLERKKALANLTGEFARVQAALKSFGDVTEQVSAVQERLSKVQSERETRRGFIKEFAFGDTQQRFNMLQARQATMAASRTGNINAVPEQLRGAVSSMLERFKDVRLPEFGGRTGDELSKTLEANVLRQMGASEEMINAVLNQMPEEEKLIDDLKILGLQEQQAALTNLALEATQQNNFAQRLDAWADQLDLILNGRLGSPEGVQAAQNFFSGGVPENWHPDGGKFASSGRIGGHPGTDNNLALIGNREVILKEQHARQIGPTLDAIGVPGVGRNFKNGNSKQDFRMLTGDGSGNYLPDWDKVYGNKRPIRRQNSGPGSTAGWRGHVQPSMTPEQKLIQNMRSEKQQQMNTLMGQSRQPQDMNLGFKSSSRANQYRKSTAKGARLRARARRVFHLDPDNAGKKFWADRDPSEMTARQRYRAGYGSQAGGRVGSRPQRFAAGGTRHDRYGASGHRRIPLIPGTNLRDTKENRVKLRNMRRVKTTAPGTVAPGEGERVKAAGTQGQGPVVTGERSKEARDAANTRRHTRNQTEEQLAQPIRATAPPTAAPPTPTPTTTPSRGGGHGSIHVSPPGGHQPVQQAPEPQQPDVFEQVAPGMEGAGPPPGGRDVSPHPDAVARMEAGRKPPKKPGEFRDRRPGESKHKYEQRRKIKARRDRELATGGRRAKTKEEKKTVARQSGLKHVPQRGYGGEAKRRRTKHMQDYRAGRVDSRGRQRPDAGRVRPGPGGPPQQPGGPPQQLTQEQVNQQLSMPPAQAVAAQRQRQRGPQAQPLSPAQQQQQNQQQALIASGRPGAARALAQQGQRGQQGQQGQQGQGGGQQMPDIAAFNQAMSALVENVGAVGQGIANAIEKLAGFQLKHEHNHSGTINIGGVENAKQEISQAIIQDVKDAINKEIDNLTISGPDNSGKSTIQRGGQGGSRNAN